MPWRDETARDHLADWMRRQRKWAVSFERDRNRSGLTRIAVARNAGLAPSSLDNYLSGRRKLDPAFLVDLANQVDGSALDYAAILGFVPEQLLLAGQALERARREVDALRAQLVDVQTQGVATGSIVEAAIASGRWSVSVMPWFEGPQICRLRLGDIVTFTSSTGDNFSAGDLRADPLLARALSTANAVRQPSALWGGDARPERDPATDARAEWIWAVPHLNVTIPASLVPKRLNARSIAVVSSQLAAWTADVASLVGRALGYASTNTGVLSRTALGEDLRDQAWGDPKSQRGPARAAIAADLLAHAADSSYLTVWGHATLGSQEAIIETLGRVSSPTLLVFLRPTDTLHVSVTHRARQPADAVRIAGARDQWDAAIEQCSLETLTLDVGFPSDLDPTAPLTRQTRDAFFERSIIVALRILDYLRVRYGGPGLDDLHEDAPAPFAAIAGQSSTNADALWSDDFALTPGRTFV